MNGSDGLVVGGIIAFYVLLLAVVFVGLGLGIWAIVDAARRPDWQFEVTGQNRVVWCVLPAVGIAFCQLLSLVTALIYLLSVRKKLAAAVPPSYGYGTAAPPSTWPGPPPGGGWGPSSH